MANKTIGQLTAKTTPANADVFALEDTEDTKKINYDALADAILNKITSKNYTVAGSSQTLINAINTLNSNTLQGSRGANKNPDVYTTIGYYYNTNYEITLTGLPVKTGYLYVLPLPGAPGYLKQIFMPYNSNKMAIRTQYDDGGGAKWTDWELLPERAEITALNSNMQSLNGGMAKRIAGSVASGATMTIVLDSSFSVNDGFALISLNIGGNALAGCALLYLGRGTSKVGKIFGDMPAQYYSASYSNGVWTITNNSESTMFITAIVSK